MIKVELINKEEIKNLYKTWGTFARQCYNTPKGKEEVVGRHCHKSAHYSGSRTTSFIFEISGISRACIAQINRHCIGVTINERSMRYVDFSNAKNSSETPRFLFFSCFLIVLQVCLFAT